MSDLDNPRDITAAAQASRLYLIEDDTSILQFVQQRPALAPQLAPAGVSGNLTHARQHALKSAVDVYLVDLGLPDGRGETLLHWLSEERPDAELLVFTVFGDETRLLAALQAGATGYVLKGCSHCELVQAIEQIQSGGAPISPLLARMLLGQFQGGQPDGARVVRRWAFPRRCAALGPRNRGAAAVGQGLCQQGDCLQAGDFAGHGGLPHQEPLPQARGAQPRAGGSGGAGARVVVMERLRWLLQRGMRWPAYLWAGWLVLLMLGVLAWTTGVETFQAPKSWTQAERGRAGRRSAQRQWASVQRVDLPHVVQEPRRDFSGQARYTLCLARRDGQASGQRRHAGHLAVPGRAPVQGLCQRGGGSAVRAGTEAPAISTAGTQAHLVMVPPSLLDAGRGDNVVQVEVQGQPLRISGLGPVWIGDADALHQRARWLTWWQVNLTWMVMGSAGLMGLLTLVIWIQTGERLFGLLAGGLLCLTVRLTLSAPVFLPGPFVVWDFIHKLSFAWYCGFLYLFMSALFHFHLSLVRKVVVGDDGDGAVVVAGAGLERRLPAVPGLELGDSGGLPDVFVDGDPPRALGLGCEPTSDGGGRPGHHGDRFARFSGGADGVARRCRPPVDDAGQLCPDVCHGRRAGSADRAR